METVNIPEQQDAAIYQAFHLMWDYYPAVVMLIRADRTIVDVNDFGKRLGVTRGSKCFQLIGDTEKHETCLADEALEERVAKRSAAYVPALNGVYDSFWLPIDGREDYYVHFSIDITQYANPGLFPEINKGNEQKG